MRKVSFWRAMGCAMVLLGANTVQASDAAWSPDQEIEVISNSGRTEALESKEDWSHLREEVLSQWLGNRGFFKSGTLPHTWIMDHDLTELEWFLLTGLPSQKTAQEGERSVKILGNEIHLHQAFASEDNLFRQALENVNALAKKNGYS
jgi:hypothetical protein